MKEFLWQMLAWVVSRKLIADYLIRRAQRTPYTHLPGYMNRDWVFNPYQKDAEGNERCKYPWLPSVRVHHILRSDLDRHEHDHPWDARTIILRGSYTERRLLTTSEFASKRGWAAVFDGRIILSLDYGRLYAAIYERKAGDTATLRFGEFHSITHVPEGGVWTLFFTWKYLGTWGFLVDGKKIPWRDYQRMYPEKPWASEERS